MKVALYARVSRSDLNLENQLGPLRKRAAAEGWEAEEVTEKESTRNTRPIKEDLLRRLRSKDLQGVAVYSLDRWCRSVPEFAQELEEFEKRGIAFYSLREGFNFDTAMGKAMAYLAMVFAQLERDLIRERTVAGLERAKAWGKIGGRHPKDCGCGFRSPDGNITHDGRVKPVREGNKIVGWQFQ